jgi:hypothetical protein
MRMSKLLLLVCLVLVGYLGASAQTCDLLFVQGTNDGTNYDVKIQIRASVAFKLGSSNLSFTYNATDLSNPVILTRSNFDGGNYDALGLAVSSPNASLNIVLNVTNSGTTVPTSYIDVATIRFTTVHKNGSSSLAWYSSLDGTRPSVVYKDDESTLLATSALGNLNTSPLPIQLSNFVASAPVQGQAGLHWTTLSEINNYGFEVQKAMNSTESFQTIPGAFIAGNGTSVVKHDYSYVDMAYQSGSVYRLKQIDLNGTAHFTDAVDPLGVTGVAGKVMPTVYSLSQNYPNPFNPSTVIEFALPKDAYVKLEVYNILGQKVATLVDEVRPAGYYSVKLDGTNLASGMYLYRLTAGNQTFLKKLVLMK